jgi:hypothetical protein
MSRYEYPSLRQGLVGAWCPSLMAGGIKVPNLSGIREDGSLQVASYEASGSGVSLVSSASNWLSASPSSIFTSSASLSFWIRKRNTSDIGGWLCEGALQSATHYTFGGLCYVGTFRNQSRLSFSPLASVDLMQWHNVCITTDGVSWGFFQAGQLAFSTAAQSAVSFSSGLFEFGRSRSTSQTFTLNANWDDIRLYNRALTASEIRLLASRRGIGLTPLPDRAAGMPRKLSVNVGGVWRPADAYVHDGTAFRLSEAKINVSGVWK